MKYYYWGIGIALIALGVLFAFTHDWLYVYEAVVLSFIEVSMSFDNAVVNATKLNTMSHRMRLMFLWFGMPVAVLGMRFLLPLIMVSFLGGVSFSGAFHLAVHDQAKFASVLSSSHALVAGFGGAFLMLTALEYFVNSEKDSHWIQPIENWLSKLGAVFGGGTIILPIVITTIVAIITTIAYAYSGLGKSFLWSAAGGMITFTVVGILKAILEDIDSNLVAQGAAIVSGGIGTLIYLEVLDASFSFDGVVAAFAISNDLFVVAVGLGIGALFIRSATIQLVETQKLAEYKYLENGAFWSILTLSVFMFVGVLYEIPSWVIAATSIGLILISAIHSKLSDTAEPAVPAVTNP